MNRILVTFHAAVRRWDVADATWAGRCDMQASDDGIWIGRGPDTTIREITVELTPAQRVASPRAVALVRDAFGDRVADLLASSSSPDDLELTIEAPVAPVPRPAAPALSGEPGVPAPIGRDRYDVPLPDGTAHVVVRVGGLDIAVPHPTPSAGERWVRISDGDSGVMLAVGPVVDTPRRSTADVPFGLDVSVDALHVWVTPDPTQPVGSRSERRRAWSQSLVAAAEQRQRRHPGEAGDIARQAARVADSIGDAELSAQARRVVEQATRRRRRRLVAIVVAAVGLTALLVALPRLLDGGDDPGQGTFFENCDEARRSGATPLLRGDPGYRAGLDRDGDGRACE